MSKEPTAIGDALAALGIDPNDNRFIADLSRYLNGGGTTERVREFCRILDQQMPGKGQQTDASDGQSDIAQTRQPMPDASHGRRASDGHRRFADRPAPVEDGGAKCDMLQGQRSIAPSSSSSRGGDGRSLRAHDMGHSKPAVPAANPARTTRGLSSILSTQPTIRKGFLFVQKTSYGKPWGDVGYHELHGMDRDGDIARMILTRIPAPADQFAKLNHILSDAQFMEIYDASQKQIGNAV